MVRLFTTTGQRISTLIRQKLEITAANGGNTTFFGSDADGDGFPNFFGTSAAAPNAAAVAALMQQQNRVTPLAPDRIVSILE
ncbi:S8 family serine peptidase [Fibrella forsythiae]|uniref:S8 family serine peptidase n=1 Tax=Fibrella forsythiae TaxID=2817061 RepID=UPI001E46686B|nr:S8 family serine peptidase [Fibrella forsythiae]